jgi:hypothetical protein
LSKSIELQYPQAHEKREDHEHEIDTEREQAGAVFPDETYHGAYALDKDPTGRTGPTQSPREAFENYEPSHQQDGMNGQDQPCVG